MPKLKYRDIKFKPDTLAIIEQANVICDEYAAQGFVLTLRQLYYQFVSRALIPNRDSEYKRLGGIVSDARMAGLLDWGHVEDRTRNMHARGHWDDPADMLVAAADSHHLDMWSEQEYRIEVWIEKDALVGVIQGVCDANDVAYTACRGYTSQSEAWQAGAVRLSNYQRQGQGVLVLHLGDHDPSGIDATRDLDERLRLFCYRPLDLEVRRIALTWDQVLLYSPPPNPAKTTDARFVGYQREYGDESWELDALEPQVISDLIQAEIDTVRDLALWEDKEQQEKREKALLRLVSDHWDELEPYIIGTYGEPEVKDE